MNAALRLALSGKQDTPRTWGPRRIFRGMKVKVIKCKAIAQSLCLHRDLIGKTGSVVRVESDHALVQFESHVAWIPQFHLREAA